MFEKALPIWAAGRENEKNLALTFRFLIGAKKGDDVLVKIACCSVYSLYVNADFEAFGPARAAKGYFRQDLIRLRNLRDGKNVICVTVCGYNINSFCTIDQSAFLCAEIICNKEVAAFTQAGTPCREFSEKTQKVQRYSYQRNFAEHYALGMSYYEFLAGKGEFENQTTAVCSAVKYLQRRAPYPRYERLHSRECDQGTVIFEKRTDYKRDRSLTRVGTRNYKGYMMSELPCVMSDEAQEMSFKEAPMSPGLRGGEYRMFAFAHNASGFVSMKIRCKKPSIVYICFDEILTNEIIDTTRLDCCNVIKIELDRGEYQFISFEPYTMKYVSVVLKSGQIEFDGVDLIEYKHPPFTAKLPDIRDKQLIDIAQSAIETFLQNAVDIFTDCPSRERAGWLCDSFFEGRVERLFCGEAQVEKDFLENYTLVQKFDNLPDQMVAMCYPADHVDGNYIPTWAMWLILEVYEYCDFTGDSEMRDKMERIARNLCLFFEKYENEEGLLSKLDKWVFVEWSAANDFVQDVNYPVNMLYYAFLNCCGIMYGWEELIQKAKNLKAAIRQKSFNGEYFTDNAVYGKDGVLRNTENITEVCQYYAFFCKVADKEAYPKLYNVLLSDFGPQRKISGKHKNVHPANAFIGNYLRLEILYRYGESERLKKEIKDYFYPMAQKTGTLWEHNDTRASCCHGFASHILCWLADMV